MGCARGGNSENVIIFAVGFGCGRSCDRHDRARQDVEQFRLLLARRYFANSTTGCSACPGRLFSRIQSADNGAIQMNWRKLIVRQKLVKAFRLAGIYLGTPERPIYPRIRSIKIDCNITKIVFTLPAGLDPKLLEKNAFVFRQIYSNSADFDGDDRNVCLTVYNAKMPLNLSYNAAEILAQMSGHKLGVICGKDRNARYVSIDLTQQPHILIAGETGSGKSSQLRSILTTMILAKKASELQLYLADCKKSEFHIFRRVEHVQCVYSAPDDIRRMLQQIKHELIERSALTEEYEVAHVDDLPADCRRPYIVIAIDEFVMLRKDDVIMDILTEIVAIGRTLGVFAILSMQRPSAKILDTNIRINLTVSMGFKLRDKIEARIANTPRADEIEVPGRFIMNADKVREIQAPYLSMEEAKRLLTPFYIDKQPKPPKTEYSEVFFE